MRPCSGVHIHLGRAIKDTHSSAHPNVGRPGVRGHPCGCQPPQHSVGPVQGAAQVMECETAAGCVQADIGLGHMDTVQCSCSSLPRLTKNLEHACSRTATQGPL